MRTIHELKCWPEYFQAVMDGIKPFEVRLNDRDYHVGDILHLLEYVPSTETYSGRQTFQRVTYVLDDSWFVKPGYVILGITEDGSQ